MHTVGIILRAKSHDISLHFISEPEAQYSEILKAFPTPQANTETPPQWRDTAVSLYMPFNLPFSYPLIQCPITYVFLTESFNKPRSFHFLEFNMTCKNLWDQTNSIYMHFILGFKCHVFNAWEQSVWPKHVYCVDGINKICCGSQLYVYQFLNPRKAKQYSYHYLLSLRSFNDITQAYGILNETGRWAWMTSEKYKVYLPKETEKTIKDSW
jgi:hypothetical protein